MNNTSTNKVAIKDKKTETESAKTSVKFKSRVCFDCDYAYFSHSECDWFCTLINEFTKGYCEVVDE